jgi:hypothetical protein
MSSSQRSPILVYLEGGFASPAGKGPRGLESQAITRAAWRFDTLTQRCRLVPLLGTGRKGPHRSLAVARRSFLGAITAALGGSGGSNSIPCAQVITTGVGACGVGSGQEIENWQITPERFCREPPIHAMLLLLLLHRTCGRVSTPYRINLFARDIYAPVQDG